MLHDNHELRPCCEVAPAHERIRRRERDLFELSCRNARLARLAHSDPLTGLGNQSAFDAHLGSAVASVDRHGGSVSIIAIDLDGMKRINDRCGHPFGDRQLVQAAAIIRAGVRGADFAARIGGDEFAVVLPATGALQAFSLAERLHRRLGGMPPCGGHRLTASVGVATFRKRGSRSLTAAQLHAAADGALHQAKRRGKNTIVLYEDATLAPASSSSAPAR